jgi:hypothetical protein
MVEPLVTIITGADQMLTNDPEHRLARRADSAHRAKGAFEQILELPFAPSNTELLAMQVTAALAMLQTKIDESAPAGEQTRAAPTALNAPISKTGAKQTSQRRPADTVAGCCGLSSKKRRHLRNQQQRGRATSRARRTSVMAAAVPPSYIP